jgi:hypothetical protein
MCSLGYWPPNPEMNYRCVLVPQPFHGVLKWIYLRKGHYIVSDYVDKVTNKLCPNYPWQVRPQRVQVFTQNYPCYYYSISSIWYGCPSLYLDAGLSRHRSQFGDSQLVSKSKLSQIIQAVIRHRAILLPLEDSWLTRSVYSQQPG